MCALGVGGGWLGLKGAVGQIPKGSRVSLQGDGTCTCLRERRAGREVRQRVSGQREAFAQRDQQGEAIVAGPGRSWVRGDQARQGHPQATALMQERSEIPGPARGKKLSSLSRQNSQRSMPG